MKLFFFFPKKIINSRSFFFSSPEYQVYAKRIELLHIQIELSFSEKKAIPQFHSQVCKKTFKKRNRVTALQVLHTDPLDILVNYQEPERYFGEPYDSFRFITIPLAKAIKYLDDRDLLNLVLHEVFQKVLFVQSKSPRLFSKFLITWGPIVGIYLSTGFFSSSLSTFFELWIPNSSLLATPVILAWKRILSVFSLSIHLYSLYCYLPLFSGSLPGEKSISEVSRLLLLAGTVNSVGTYAHALSLEANSAHIKIKLVSQLVNELTNIVYKNWVIASLRFQVPLLMANQLLEYNQKFLFKQVSLNNYHLNFVVNQIQAIANIRKTYSIQNPLSLVSSSEFPTVSVTLLKLANGKQLLIGGKAAEIIDTVLLLGSNCGTTVALFKK